MQPHPIPPISTTTPPLHPTTTPPLSSLILRFNQEYQSLENTPYKRPQLVSIVPSEQNRVEQTPNGVMFCVYGCDLTDDQDWGCAWRCVQSILYNLGITLQFQEMFLVFGRRSTMSHLLLHTYHLQDDPHVHWAPHETEKGWADPFIAKLVLHYFTIESHLHILHRIPNGIYIPPSLHPSFLSLVSLLELHFHNSTQLVMIDDGNWAYCLTGVTREQESVVLFLADPHVEHACAPQSCFYSLTFDLDGTQIGMSLDQDQLDNLRSHPKNTEFKEKGWAVLIQSKGK